MTIAQGILVVVGLLSGLVLIGGVGKTWWSTW